MDLSLTGYLFNNLDRIVYLINLFSLPQIRKEGRKPTNRQTDKKGEPQ